MEITLNQIKRIKKDWEDIAKEDVRIEQVGGAIYGICSELASLRLLKAYRTSLDDAKADYSTNLNQFYFRLEIN